VERVIRRSLAAGLLAALAFSTAAAAADPYKLTIRRTSHGIPHITAGDYTSLAYGTAWAFAQDNLCVIADQYVTVRGERSRYFGPDARWTFGGNSTSNQNLASDFFHQKLIDQKVVEKLVAEPPPAGPVPEIKQAIKGYVDGYNDYLAHVGVAKIPDPACRGKEWVVPITEMDVYRRFYQLALMASSGVAIDGIGAAAPVLDPAGVSQARARQNAALEEMAPEKFDEMLGGIGSNAYGLGRKATQSGHGMVLGNPHFPWDGSERLWQSHLVIPGKVDVAGASLFGVPLINIGWTKNMAWSHTVSTARRFTPFELKLVPGSPTTYLVDGQPREMTKTQVTVQVKGADGKVAPQTRTLYDTEYGPILTGILGLPIFPWTPGSAYALGDANASNFRYLNHFFFKNQAQSVAEVDAIEKKYLGIPWVNTIAADSAGNAYYADIGSVPHVTNAKIDSCSAPLGSATDKALRVQILDGARAACNWGSDPDAIKPGIFGPKNLPSLTREDYVTNSNDSYWLTHPEQRLEGFSRVIGDERTARAPRTRLGLRIVQQRLDGSDGLPGKGFTVDQLKDAVFNNRQYLGELWRDELVAFCEQNPTMTSSGGASVDVSKACPVLKAWNLRDDLDAKGAILFRRFASRALATPGGAPVNPGATSPYRRPFDVNDPVNTPSGLNTENPQVRSALADAVKDLEGAKIPLDAGLRGFQYEKRGEEKIPIHGGPGTLGVFNALNVSWVPDKGYPDVRHGSSHVQAVELTGKCPEARTILTYSQSSSPESPYFGDQTRMYADKQWVDFPFCEADIARDRNLQRLDIGGGYGASRSALKRRGGGKARVLRSMRLKTRGKRLTVTLKLLRKARVTVTVSRKGKRVKRVSRTLRAGTRVIRIRLKRAGRHQVEVRARAGKRTETAMRASAGR
jgi:acyl-homoserine-lactone acylase